MNIVDIRLIRRNLSASKIRLFLTSVSIVLGVGFITASFVLADGLRESFNRLSATVNQGADLTVRGEDQLGVRSPLSDTLLTSLRDVPGVEAVYGQVETTRIQPVKPDGTAVTTQGPPQLGFAWIENASGPFTVASGRAPQQLGEFSLDRLSATNNKLEVGKSYDVLTPTGRHRATLVGTTSFGPENATLGATLTHFTFEQAQKWFGLEGQVNSILVQVKDSGDRASVQSSVQQLLPTRVEVASRETLTAETEDQYGAVSAIIGWILLGFAILSLFVSSFIIANTYSVVISQRTRELGLLRALGASQQQVRRIVLIEAAVVGTVASLAGIAVGIGLSAGIRAIFSALGLSLPDANVVLAPRTIAAACVAGIGVTVVAALRPARRAASVAPVAVMAASVTGAEQRASTKGRLIGLVFMAGSLALTTGGFLTSGRTVIVLLVSAAVTAVIAALLCASSLAQPFVRVVGAWLPKAFGVSGRLGLANSVRNPRRTATTASALMIGLAVVTGALVIGTSIKDHVTETIGSAFDPDTVIVFADGDPSIPSELPRAIGEELSANDLVKDVLAIRYGRIRINDIPTRVTGADTSVYADFVKIPLIEGNVVPGPNHIALLDSFAEKNNLNVGTTVSVELQDRSTRTLTISGLYSSDIVLSDSLIAIDNWAKVSNLPSDNMVVAKLKPGTTVTARARLIDEIVTTNPQAIAETPDQLADRFSGEIDQLLMVINLLMALTVIIALLGIANTLGLAVFERTREIGLLRAVGMPQSQVRRLIRLEAGLVAAFGSVLGSLLGIALGVMTALALPEDAASGAQIPVGSIAVLTLFAIVAAILSAYRPARRAARLDILEAIKLT
jgi:putative ABC transport system permease protein